MNHWLFSYGTLRQPDVQAALFGRTVATVEDSLPGYRLGWLEITDPEVISTSGSDRHPILRRGVAGDSVAGVRLEISDAELLRADEYEVDDYVRVSATLASGEMSWVYVGADLTTDGLVADDSTPEDLPSPLS
jgi:Gamma-glutamyl cyclotransferase, AIG2-like